MTPLSPWGQGALALQLLKIDPKGLGGIWLRSRAGPVRDRYLAMISNAGPIVKIAPTATNDDLIGGLDLTATLDAGRLVNTTGLLDRDGWKILTMAERMQTPIASQVAAHMDQSETAFIAIDEGISDETISPALSDRLAFQICLDDVRYSESYFAQPIDINQKCPDVPAGTLLSLVQTATAFGISGTRPVLLAVKTAKAHAQLQSRDSVGAQDIEIAAALVFAHRATQMPEAAPQDEQPQQDTAPDQTNDEQGAQTDNELVIPQDVLLEAVKANLPADLLAQLATQKAKATTPSGGGTGNRKKGNRRGRPLPPGAGRLNGRNRLDLVATLRAAAPWQKLRAIPAGTSAKLHIRSSDIRVKRFEDRSDRLLIFAVDASGSAAMARLAEAKGAVELLLAEAYARRDHVSLLAFRGEGAELLLPPTRSLVQTKRRLAGLVGGGGTPLAAGLKLGMQVAEMAKAKGLTPTLALLTDGRANIALDGTANRAQAAEDAQTMAKRAYGSGIQSLVIDVSKRPERALRTLAECLHAPYIPLPRANAERLSKAVSASLGTA